MGFLDTLSHAVTRSFGGSDGGNASANNNNTANTQVPNPQEGKMQFATPIVKPNPTGNADGTPASGTQNPGGGTGNPNPNPQAKQIDPLSIFAKIGDNAGKAETPPAFTLDPAQLSQLASGQDFTRGVAPELLTKANSGDSAAMMEVMQAMVRNAYQTGLMHTSRLTESFVGSREAHQLKALPSHVRGELTVSALSGTPNFSNPAVRKHLITVAKSLESEHPDASPEEIAALARQAVTEMAQAVNPNAAGNSGNAQGANKSRQPVDWDNWFDS